MQKFEDLKINMNLSIGFVQGRRESEPLSNFIGEDEWIELSDEEKEKFIDDCIRDWAFNYIEFGGVLE